MKEKMTDFQKLILNKQTSLEDLEAAGYSVEFNGYYTYFRHMSGKVESIPLWIGQYADKCVDRTVKYKEKQLREILGITGPNDEKP